MFEWSEYFIISCFIFQRRNKAYCNDYYIKKYVFVETIKNADDKLYLSILIARVQYFLPYFLLIEINAVFDDC